MAQWDKVQLAPTVLLKGGEQVLADRAVERLRALARDTDPAVEVSHLAAASYEPGALGYLASPSLFGERRLILVHGAESMNESFLLDALAYLAAPESDVWLVVRYGTGTRGKKLLDALAKSGEVVRCDPLKRDSDKADFVLADLHRAKRRIEKDALQALLEAVGSSLTELDAAVRQLIADTAGTITRAVVNSYYGGRVEATGFRVADAAIAGEAGQAVALARHAIATGASPVPLVGALAMKLRTLAKVGSMKARGRTAKSLGLQDWQVQRAQRELRGWTPEGLADAISAVAAADAEVKGLSRDPEFAIERAILKVAGARGLARG